jgi:hypothetical protein
MIEHAWTVACTKCVIDSETNNATLTETLETLTVPGNIQFPTIAPLQLDLVSNWYRSNPAQGTRGSGRVSFLNPNGEAAAPPTEYAIDLRNYYRSRNIVRVAGLPIAGTGVYFFKIELRVDAEQWREVARTPILVQAAPGGANVAQPAIAQ